MNSIKKCIVNEIDYTHPKELFNTLDRGSKPSLLLGEGPEDISGSAIIGLYPYKDLYFNEDIFKNLRELNNSTDFHNFEYPVNRIGAIGTISYEALHEIEKIEKRTVDSYSFPLLNWTIYCKYYYFDLENSRCWEINLNYASDIKNIIDSKYQDSGFKVSNIVPDFTPGEYKNNVDRIRNYIFNGDVYEVNLTQGLSGDFKGSPLSLFNRLYSINNSPFSSYMERDNYTLVSNSPELYLRCQGPKVETRPIKGTAPRSNNQIEDDRLAEELMNSHKNQAELYMIVDLMRNDLSRVSKVGSVKVREDKRIEHYRNVHHLVSIVEGELDSNMDYVDLIRATFPGGSITGCPKVRCMEITEELEKTSRNIYTGTVFLMNREFFNSSIVIRTSIIQDGRIFINSGGAITIDSEPEEEYRETLIKLNSILKAVDCEDSL